MPKIKKDWTLTNKSKMRITRVPLAYDAHLIEKAKNNPDNPRNEVGREINALIKADYEKSQKNKRVGAKIPPASLRSWKPKK